MQSPHPLCTWIGILLLALAAPGCEEETSGPVEPAIYPSSSSIILDVGESRNLSVTRVPSGTAFHAMSESPLVASVTQGASSISITGVCEGFITVFLTMPAYPGIDADVTVEVTDDDPDPPDCGN